MKITKRQLKRIIKEERAKLLKEQTPADAGMAAARHEGRADYGYIADQIDGAARALEQVLIDAEGALILADQKSLVDDLEDLVNNVFQMAVTFDKISENQ